MSRRATMTADAVKSALEREAADDFVSLIEVTFPDTDTLRYCNQAVEHMLDADGFAVEDEHGVPVYGMYHKGRFYQFLPFELPNPEDASGKAPSSAHYDLGHEFRPDFAVADGQRAGVRAAAASPHLGPGRGAD